MSKPPKPPLLKQVMTAFPYYVRSDAPLLEARRMMLQHHIRHLPVMAGHDLTGIVTDRDIKLLLGPEMGSPDPRELTVADAAVEDSYVADLDTPLATVLGEMAERHIGAALVTGHGRLAGIFTATDACRAFARHLGEDLDPGEPGDAA